MKKLSSSEIRQMYLDFFQEKGHKVQPSASLIPVNDPTLLWINSGVATLKKYFDGTETPEVPRITNAQKSIRTNDIENVGHTARHHTLFEMMGNFSIGDYFKEEVIPWAWEFLTSEKWLGLDPNRLYVTYYPEDPETKTLWMDKVGLPEDHIIPVEDNFWDIGAGPCGPDTEIFYDRGEKYNNLAEDDPENYPGGENERYLEIWNLVFSQFNHMPDGTYPPLPHKNVDTGMGLERVVSVIQDTPTNFETDLFMPIIKQLESLSAGKKYNESKETDVSFKVIADHIRAVSFAIGDGALPSNEGRGYVLRRLIRRAARHGRLLGIKGTFLSKLSEEVINGSKAGYPELEEKKEFIFKVLTNEENQFNKTIDQGLRILADMEEEMKAAGEKTLSGDNAFKLYDTYGFPLDLTKEILEEKGYGIDEDGFQKAMEEQRVKARTAREVTNYMGADATVYDEIDVNVTTEFVGYDHLAYDSEITVLTTEKEIAASLMEGQKGTVFVKETPFYATMGGQEGDCGVIETANGRFVVEDTIKLRGGKFGHVGHMESGMLSTGETVTLKVNEQARRDTEKNHSATHLLQKALKTVLGSHVEQKGSLVTPDRLRFDFAHFQAMTPEEIAQTEALVNKEIQAALPVVTDVMDIEEAKKSGAMALFGEKYDQKVRVVSMGDFSRELCGGTHVKNTSTIMLFKIVSEAGVAAGVRRIEALTGNGVIEYYKKQEAMLHEAAKALKAQPAEVAEKISHLQAEVKSLQSENESLKSKLAQGSLGDVMNQVVEIKGVKLLAAKVEGVDMNGLRDLGDQLKEKLGEGVVVLAAVNGGKVNLLAMATDAAQKAGAHAGNLIKGVAAIAGGGGGGRPNMAQAGGKNPEKAQEAIDAAAGILEQQIH